jgi:molybdate transport system substrate-binding protein
LPLGRPAALPPAAWLPLPGLLTQLIFRELLGQLCWHRRVGSRMPVSRRNVCSRLAALLAAAFVCLLAAVAPAQPAEAITVFAAASLTNAIEAIGQAYQEKTGQPVRYSFAASSALARQIEAGAPAAIFASADEAWMNYLAERGLIVVETRVSPIGNRLVLIAPKDSAMAEVELRPDVDLAALLGNGRLATGDPDHVPVGRYARDALTTLGAWAAVEPKLARAESVRAALALVERGEAPLGIVYASDAQQSAAVRVIATFPENTYTPIVYPMAIVTGHDTPAARALLAAMSDAAAAAVYRRFGFTPR